MPACAACRDPLPEVREYQNTCSRECHEVYIAMLETYGGETKRVTDASTGKTHLVPTRYIAEHGLKHEDLRRFPEEET